VGALDRRGACHSQTGENIDDDDCQRRASLAYSWTAIDL
jgi:hypothetical protein